MSSPRAPWCVVDEGEVGFGVDVRGVPCMRALLMRNTAARESMRAQWLSAGRTPLFPTTAQGRESVDEVADISNGIKKKNCSSLIYYYFIFFWHYIFPSSHLLKQTDYNT